MDSVKINHISINGPGLWHLLHRMAMNASNPSSQQLFTDFLPIFEKALTCDLCHQEFIHFKSLHPLEQYQNTYYYDGHNIGYFQWTWELHNYVNTKLSKPLVSLTSAYKYYTTHRHECPACIKL